MERSDFYQQAKHSIGFAEGNNRIDQALKVLLSVSAEKFVDLGCGDGSLLAILKEKQPNLDGQGFEISRDAVKIAKSRGLNVSQWDFEKTQLPVDAGSIDMVFLGEVIEHVYGTDELLEEIYRVLRPGGWLLLTTPNMAAWYNRLGMLFGFQPIFTEVSARSNAGHFCRLPGMPAGHIRVFTYRALKEVVRRNGFAILKTYGIGLNTKRKGIAKFIISLVNLLFMHPSVSSGLVMLVRKRG